MQEIINKIKKAKNIGIFTHINADPDALGSTSAFLHALKQLNKNYTVFLNESVEEGLEFLKIDNVSLTLLKKDFDLFISFDSASLERLGIFAEEFASHENTIEIDHHASRTEFAKLTYVETVSSNCEIVFKLLNNMDVEITQLIATCLYTGLVSDTNSFKTTSTTPNSHEIAKQLLMLGADFSLANKALFQNKSLSDFEILKRVMERVEFTKHIGISYITEKDRIELNKDRFNTSELIEMITTVKQVEISVLIKQTTGKNYSISLRSSKHYNVAEFASRFGGGGHNQASGMSLTGSLAQIKRILLKGLEKLEKSN